MTDKAAYDFMRKAIDGNHQLLAHTNGDAAADQYLRVYKRALEGNASSEAAALHGAKAAQIAALGWRIACGEDDARM